MQRLNLLPTSINGINGKYQRSFIKMIHHLEQWIKPFFLTLKHIFTLNLQAGLGIFQTNFMRGRHEH